LRLSLAVLAVGLLAAGCLPQRVERPGRASAASGTSAERPRTELPPEPEVSGGRSATSYTAITERNLFRPLVAAPRGPQGAPAPPSTVAKLPAETKKPSSPPRPAGPPRPPDPLADLALTGVIQAGDALKALIEHISTRVGQYVIVGDMIDGFRVKLIRVDSVVLEKGGREYTLRLGQKELPAAPVAAPPPKEAPKMEGPRTENSTRAHRRGSFLGDWGSWADRMSLAQLEAMYASYKDRMSPEQRAQAEQYLAQRRARGN
jgi:hypothetical protein